MTSALSATVPPSSSTTLSTLSDHCEANLLESALLDLAVARGEGALSIDGAFVAETGVHTGRSPKDKYVVRDAATESTVWWSTNQEMAPETFDGLLEVFLEHAGRKDLLLQQLYGGADPEHRLGVDVYCEEAWHALFIRHLLRRPDAAELENFKSELTIIDLPSLKVDADRFGLRSDTVIACDLSRKIILIGGTRYAGEIKKSVFSFLNFWLPEENILPMHCSANVGPNGDSAVFFGLSGTGKTTLSADPARELVGDDEHGWSDKGIFNFEGGCYAKTIRLSQENEPEIYGAARRAASVLENVILKGESQEPDFDDVSLTENTRCAYPLEAIANALPSGMAAHPRNIVMLTADAFGVLPPIARLAPEQAMVHFLSGYTAKVAGTERGVTEPEATFSACFGGPFMPRHPAEYGELLRAMMLEHGTTCWLLNTGWTGGPYGTGERMPLKATRALLNAALAGELDGAKFRRDENFKVDVPLSGPATAEAFLNPRETWADGEAYDAQAQKLAQMFRDNFQKFQDRVSSAIFAALP